MGGLVSAVSRMGSSSVSSTSRVVDDEINKQIFMPPDRWLLREQYAEDPIKVMDAYSNEYENGISTELFVFNEQKQISALIVKPEKPDKVVIFSHGNASDFISMKSFCMKLVESLNIGIVCYDYPGYGLSDGTPTEQSCYDCFEEVMKKIKKEGLKEDDTILVGQSLGTGVVVDWAVKHGWTRPIILISPYKSIGTVVFDSTVSSMFIDPVDKFKTIDKVKDLKCMVKIFHGKRDKVIDITHAETIFENLPDQTLEPVWIQTADHNDILEKLLDKEYFEDMKQIISYP